MINRKAKQFIYFNSLAYLLLAYVIVYMISHLGVSLVSLSFQVPTIITNVKIFYLTEESSWTRDNVVVIFLSRTIMYLLLMLFFLVLHKRTIIFTGYLKTVLMWGLVLSFLLFNGEIIFGNIFNNGIFFSLEWLFLTPTTRLILILISLIIFTIGAVSFGSVFVNSSNIYFPQINSDNITPYFLYHLFYPYLTFTALLTLFVLPEFPLLLTLSAYTGIILLIIALFFMGNIKRFINEEQKIKPIQLDIKTIIVIMVIVAAFVISLKKGIMIS